MRAAELASREMSRPVGNEKVQLLSELKGTDEELVAIRSRLQALIKKSDKIAREDPLPLEFVGIVHGYRFSGGKAGEMPYHRFQVESDKGLWLFVQVESAQFDVFVRDLDMDGAMKPSKINGKLVKVRRDEALGKMVPVGFLGEPLCRDATQRLLFPGAIGTYSGSEVTVIGSNGLEGQVNLQYTDTSLGEGQFAAYGYDVTRVA
jgi:hypothetical protein